MINVTLKGGVVKQYAQGTKIFEVAKSLGAGLYKDMCAAKVNGELKDVKTELLDDCSLEILTFDDTDGKKTYWHTTAHIMAQAVCRLFKNVKLAIGPAIDSGFYYDFDLEKSLTNDDLVNIEEEMQKIIKEDLEVEKFTLKPDEALDFMKEHNQPYKVELIEDLAEKGCGFDVQKTGRVCGPLCRDAFNVDWKSKVV